MKRNLQAWPFDDVITGCPEECHFRSHGRTTSPSLTKDSIITCDPNALTLQVPKCAFENINFDWSKAYLAGPDKTPQLDGNDLNPCTGVENGNEVVFRNIDPHKVIILVIENLPKMSKMDHLEAFLMISNHVVLMFLTMVHTLSIQMPYKDQLECRTLLFLVLVMSRYACN